MNRDFITAEYSVQRDGFDIYIFLDEEGKRYQVTNMETDELPKNMHAYSPVLTLRQADAQQLFDDLWRAGLRPKTQDESPAKDNHLRDLRMILFHQLGMTK